jgi:hypothetical protein
MIGDIKQKRGAKAEAYKGKNAKGQSYKINLPSSSDGGGDPKQKTAAKRAMKGMRNGVGSKDKQNPAKQRDRKTLVARWCEGKGDCPLS